MVQMNLLKLLSKNTTYKPQVPKTERPEEAKGVIFTQHYLWNWMGKACSDQLVCANASIHLSAILQWSLMSHTYRNSIILHSHETPIILRRSSQACHADLLHDRGHFNNRHVSKLVFCDQSSQLGQYSCKCHNKRTLTINFPNLLQKTEIEHTEWRKNEQRELFEYYVRWYRFSKGLKAVYQRKR